MPQHKKYKQLLVPVIAVGIISIAAVFFLAGKQPVSEKQRIAEEMVQSLNAYKNIHKRYPTSLEEIKPAAGTWLLYSPDTTKRSFTLSYQKNIVKPSYAFYESATGTWKERFTNKIRP